jgi:hypothetical protein
MADAQAAFLASLLGGGGSTGADVADLGAFQQSIAANDLYSQIAQPIFGAKFDKSTWTPQQAGITNAIQAFTGTLLSQLGKNQQAAQVAAVNDILPQLYADPASVALPEGVDPLAFGQLRSKAIARSERAKSSQLAKYAEDLWGIKLKKAEAKATESGKIEGQNEEYGIEGGVMNPNDPRIAIADNFRKELLANKDITSFAEVRDRMKVLQKAALDPSSVADLDFYIGIAKMLDPDSVVRESEGKNILESGSIPQSIQGYINKGLNGQAGVPRQELYALAQRHYDVRSGRVASILDDYGQRAKARGITENIFPFSRESLDISADTPSTDILKAPSGAAPKLKASELVAKGYKLSADGKRWEPPNG